LSKEKASRFHETHESVDSGRSGHHLIVRCVLEFEVEHAGRGFIQGGNPPRDQSEIELGIPGPGKDHGNSHNDFFDPLLEQSARSHRNGDAADHAVVDQKHLLAGRKYPTVVVHLFAALQDGEKFGQARIVQRLHILNPARKGVYPEKLILKRVAYDVQQSTAETGQHQFERSGVEVVDTHSLEWQAEATSNRLGHHNAAACQTDNFESGKIYVGLTQSLNQLLTGVGSVFEEQISPPPKKMRG